jgi:hypothetical protein
MKSFIIVNFKDYQIKLPVNDEQPAPGRTKLENLFMKVGSRRSEIRSWKSVIGHRQQKTA